MAPMSLASLRLSCIDWFSDLDAEFLLKVCIVALAAEPQVAILPAPPLPLVKKPTMRVPILAMPFMNSLVITASVTPPPIEAPEHTGCITPPPVKDMMQATTQTPATAPQILARVPL